MTLQGSKVTQTLYYKSSSGAYIDFGESLYRAGNSRTFRKRGDLIDTALYYDGGSETIHERGNLLAASVYYAGTKRANLKLATFDATTAMLAYAK